MRMCNSGPDVFAKCKFANIFAVSRDSTAKPSNLKTVNNSDCVVASTSSVQN